MNSSVGVGLQDRSGRVVGGTPDAGRPGAISTAEIKARIEAMFADRPGR